LEKKKKHQEGEIITNRRKEIWTFRGLSRRKLVKDSGKGPGRGTVLKISHAKKNLQGRERKRFEVRKVW